jgi:hypothetical protein
MAISAALATPLVLADNRIIVRPIPGVSGLHDLSSVAGSEVLKVGHFDASDILKFLNGSRPEDIRKAAELLWMSGTQFDIEVRKPDGTTQMVHINQGG